LIYKPKLFNRASMMQSPTKKIPLTRLNLKKIVILMVRPSKSCWLYREKHSTELTQRYAPVI
jgi:hypothetical protein